MSARPVARVGVGLLGVLVAVAVAGVGTVGSLATAKGLAGYWAPAVLLVAVLVGVQAAVTACGLGYAAVRYAQGGQA